MKRLKISIEENKTYFRRIRNEKDKFELKGSKESRRREEKWVSIKRKDEL